ncbi:asparagine synthase-related protein [Empedobacter brevis]|uniref:asparagine synthase (glutamine-hydrolyzing) n=1 Tax=Empedobacter brevis NBRC 14943 = ATCC 43319 TaxID=1218108 RepID=A0A511NF01_9FLAO|nr:asparagine synthase-related protein [Empedobacter brevis]GEM50881.1 hypothetical protein EB1_06710 [Empedobacter brevis NBRC 14943 = ATCC 43319]
MKGFQLYIKDGIVEYEIRFQKKRFDNYFIEQNNIVIAIEGVLLNKNQLIKTNNLNENYLHQLYILHQLEFIQQLEGEFVGFVYNKLENKVYTFTNFTATRKLFYYNYGNEIIIETSLISLVKALKKATKFYSLDESAMYQLLVCGNTLEDYTPIKEVKKLRDAELLQINVTNLQTKIDSYYTFKDRFNGDKQEALEEIDRLFNEAVCLEFEKDKELKKETFALLSGGLDSRMTLLVALKNGYQIDETFCFSQKKYWDETIAKQIANEYGIPFHFVALNGGEYITEIDEIFQISEGLGAYSSALHTNFAYKFIDKEKFGLVHSGQLGDGVLGMFNKNRYKTPPSKAKIIVHDRLFHRLESDFNEIASNYDREEIFLTRNVGYNRTVLGSYLAEEFSYQTSPFMYSHFLKFAHSLPEEWKYNQELYIEWINKYHKEATNYIWERTLLKPTSKRNTILGDKIVKRMYNGFLNKVFQKQYIGKMTAYEYYYKQEPKHREKMDEYFERYIHAVKSTTLKQDLYLQYNEGSFVEKTTVLTVLSIVKHYFSE